MVALCFFVIAYLAIGTLLFLFQDSLIYYADFHKYARLPENVERIEVEVKQNPSLVSRGYVMNRQAAGPVIVFFTGNAAESGRYIDDFQQFEATIVMTNYRGFGGSDGKPSESAILSDSQVLIHWVRKEFPERPIVLMGFSLGSGVAILSSDSATDGLILVSPYRSLVHVARRSMIGVFPLDLLMRTKFDSRTRLNSLPDRVIVLYSKTDKTIPAKETMNFLELVPHALVIEDSVQHNQLLGRKNNLNAIADWLQSGF
ncbi:MAG: alpha/beta hydrolase [Gammaproteobacteria bacterium]|nr:alpha/beta hydrolase [Gammaproteobacteria bacterium]